MNIYICLFSQYLIWGGGQKETCQPEKDRGATLKRKWGGSSRRVNNGCLEGTDNGRREKRKGKRFVFRRSKG